MKADLIILDGSVLTINDEAPRAEGVAVANGKIVAVGSNAEIGSWRIPGTRVISARGGTVLPGFVEAHMHLLWRGLTAIAPLPGRCAWIGASLRGS